VYLTLIVVLLVNAVDAMIFEHTAEDTLPRDELPPGRSWKYELPWALTSNISSTCRLNKPNQRKLGALTRFAILGDGHIYI
jgi:hypothetical protein